MLRVVESKKYQKSFIKLYKAGQINLDKLNVVVNTIAAGETLPKKYRDHQLSGQLSDYRECHVRGDLLLLYQIREKELLLVLVNIGSHSGLF
jgi:mRNA interferase YafQ